MDIAGRKIALGVCGGIAAYKAVEIARTLTLAGADVHVIMTKSATEFVGPITFSTLTGNPVRTELFPPAAPTEIAHTDLGRTADVVVIAPATANTIAKYVQGVTDDLVSATLLSARGPIIMAPAMHTEMWEDAATRENIATLARRGVRFVGPDSGALAGPDVGVGRLAAIESIIDAIHDELRTRIQMNGLHVIVTAGGTQEPIDAVRFIGNRSSGRMGVEIAFEALRRGAKVTLITAPTHLPTPDAADVIRVMTAGEMRDAVISAAGSADIIVMAAAVADWRPGSPPSSKLKKEVGPPRFDLEPTADILAELGSSKRQEQVLVGFCAETEDVAGHARAKRERKKADLMVGNLVGAKDSGFDVETNLAVIVSEDESEDLPLMSKRELARLLLDRIAARIEQRQVRK